MEIRLALIEPEKHPQYWTQLDYEIRIIEEMGFPAYMLIVAEFINWSKDNGIPVGPGRGSAAGSIVAWAMGITDIDPIKFELLFERFLNPERISMPDISMSTSVRTDEKKPSNMFDKNTAQHSYLRSSPTASFRPRRP